MGNKQLIKLNLFEPPVKIVNMAVMRLQEFCPKDKPYFGAFSGGKDSIVIKHLAQLAGVPVDWHYQRTGVDPPELVYFIREHHPDVIFDIPETTMWDLMRKNLYPPLRHMRYCCRELKESSGSDRSVITGVRWAESKKRALKRKLTEFCPSKGRITVNPIIDWSNDDVWSFIRNEKLPYCSLYNEGWKRLGCILCPLGNQQKEARRWPKIAAQYKRVCGDIYDLIQAKDDNHTFRSGDDIYFGWITGKHVERTGKDQEVLYE